MKENISCISIYSNIGNIESAIKELQAVNCNLRHVSIMGKCSQNAGQLVGCYSNKGHICYIGSQGQFWNNLCNLLTGSAFFLEPELGPLLVVGQMTEFIINSRQIINVNDRLSFLGRVLFTIGVPIGNINEYEQAIKTDNILLLVHGDPEHVEQACDTLHGATQQVIVHRA